MSSSMIPPYVRNEPRDDYVLQSNDWLVLKSAALEMTMLIRQQGELLEKQVKFMERQETARIASEKNTKLNVVSVIAVFIATLNVALLSYVRDTFGDSELSTSGNVVIGCLFMSIILALIPAFLTSFMNHGGVSEWFKSVGMFYGGVFSLNSEKMHTAICGKIVTADRKLDDKECGGIHPDPRKKHGYLKIFFVGHIMLFLSLVVKLGWFMLFLLPSIVVLVVGIVVFVWDKQSSGVGFSSSATCIYALFAILAFALNGFMRRKFKAIISD